MPFNVLGTPSNIIYSGTGIPLDPYYVESSNHSANSVAQIVLLATESGTVYPNLTVDSEIASDAAGLFRNSISIWQASGQDAFSTSFRVNAGDQVKIDYVKDASGSSGSDNITGSIYFEPDPPTPLPEVAIVVVTQPESGLSGDNLQVQPSVKIVDSNGVVVSGTTVSVTVEAVAVTGSVVLSGTLTVSPSSGYVYFTDLVATGYGSYYLYFTAAGLTPASSNTMFFVPDPGNPQPPIPVKPKRSYISGSVPTANDMVTNEFAINVTDKKGYVRDSNGVVHLVFDGNQGGSGSVTSVGLTSTDSTILISNSPITSSGNIDIDLSATSVSSGSYTNADITVDKYGRITSASNGVVGGVESITAGDGISVDQSTGAVTITNIAPDQIVSLIGGTDIVVSGAYPSFTINSSVTQYTDADARKSISAGTGISYNSTTGLISNSAPNQTVSLTGGADISVTGVYPNFTIDYTGTSSGISSIMAGNGISVDKSTGVVTITNSSPDQAVTITSGTGISTSGSYPNFTIGVDSSDITAIGDTYLKSGILDYILFDTTPEAVVSTPGSMNWNANENTLDVHLQNGVTLQTGQEEHIYARNATASVIPNATLVMYSGTLGVTGRILISPYIADGSINSALMLGVTTQDIGVNEEGYVTVFGKVRDINTSAFTAGDLLYADATTPGVMTNVVPQAPKTKALVGFVVNSHAVNGNIFVNIVRGSTLFRNEALELISLTNRDTIVYNSSVGRFENDTLTNTDVGLGNVENTALSTWAGTTNITTLGTISTGTWNGTDVALSAGGTGATLTAVNGGVVYSNGSAMAISSAGSSGQVLTSAGTNTPTWTSQSSLSVGSATTATNIAGGAGGQVHYQSASSTTALLANGTAGQLLQANGTTVAPSWVTYAGTTSITTLGTIATGTWSATNIAMNKGGTNASLTAASGSVVYSNASALGLTAVGSSGQVLTSAGTNTPTWTSQSSLAAGTATNITGGAGGQVLYQSASATTAKLANGTSGQVLQANGGTAAPSWATLTGATVGLGNVENTALSTWAGSLNLTTLGTISSGIWQASPIEMGYGGTNANLTAVSGGVVYSTATEMAITNIGDPGQVLISNGSSPPSWANASEFGEFSCGRLTLTSGNPSTTSDVIGAATIYFAPYNGSIISVYNGTSVLENIYFTQLSLPLAPLGLSNSKNYDVFVYNNNGSLGIEVGDAWLTNNTRNTGLAVINGIYVKVSDTTRRYVGTFRTTSTTTTEDSRQKRLLWNINNQVNKSFFKDTYPTYAYSGHPYTTGAWRAWNNDAQQSVHFVMGLERGLVVNFSCASGNAFCSQGAGFDGNYPGYDSVDMLGRAGRSYTLRGASPLGYHYCTMYEYGSSGANFIQGILEGSFFC